jgi:hypothetical protein
LSDKQRTRLELNVSEIQQEAAQRNVNFSAVNSADEAANVVIAAA